MLEDKGRSTRWTALLGVLPVLAGIGFVGVHVVYGELEPNTDAGAEADAEAGAEAEADAGADAGEAACTEPIVIDVKIEGSYTKYFPSLGPSHPILSTDYTHFQVHLAKPAFAAAYSIADLCSAEEATPSHLGFLCLAYEGNLVKIDFRLEPHRDLAITVDGRDVTPDRGNTPGTQLPGDCGILRTEITKHDIEPLRKSFLDDTPSARCPANGAPRRKVKAPLIHAPLPGEAELRPAHYAEPSMGRDKPCRDATSARLILPPSVAPSQYLGEIYAQCVENCWANRLRKPNGVQVACHEGYEILAYQLGDALYIVYDKTVRRVPLPCDVELDFMLEEFVAPLGIPAEFIKIED